MTEMPAGRSLEELEGVVERGLQGFVEAGRALAEIRDRGLFRGTHDSFKAYVADRWGMPAATAYQAIYGARVVDAGLEAGVAIPADVSLNAAKELVPTLNEAGPAAVAEVWSQVMAEHDGGRRPPTSGEVRRVVVSQSKPAAGERAPRGLTVTDVAMAVEAAQTRLRAFKRSAAGTILRPSDRERLRGAVAVAGSLERALAAFAEKCEAEAASAAVAARAPKRGPNPVPCLRHGRLRRPDGACRWCGYEVLEEAAAVA